MGEEGRESNEGENNSNEKNHPLSREGWIMLLSGEINKEEMKLTTYEYMGLAIRIAFFGAAVAVLVAAILSDEILLYILCLVMIFFMALPQLIYKMRYLNLHQKRLRPLINLREAIISGELTDFGEIHGIWKEYIKKYYGKLLAKSEMDKEEKESKGEKDCPLSPTDWAMFLSSEIYNMKHPDFVKIINPIMLFLIAYIGYMIASVNTVLASVFYSLYPPILALFAVTCSIVFIYWLIDFYMVGKREKALKELRRKIIFEEEKDCIKIREDWWNIVSKKGIKIIRRCRELILRFVTGYRDSKYDKKN